MKIRNAFYTLLSVALLGGITSSKAADVSRYFLVKGQDYFQTNAATVLSLTNQKPFRFTTSVDGTATDSVRSASLKLPNLQTRLLTNSPDGAADFEVGFTNKPSLDAAYGSGTYTYTIVGKNDGTNKPVLVLPIDNYPTVPRIADWNDLQTVEAVQPLNLSWGAFTNGTTNDLILLEISAADGTTVATTPALLTTNTLNGTNVTAQIPAGLLADDSTYEGRLLFVKRTSLSTNYPGAKGLAGYFRQTKFPIVTLPTPPSNGRIQLAAKSFSAVENSGTAGITITRSGTNGSVSVDFATQDGTAHDGIDYQGVSQTVNFADGETVKVFPITLLNNFLLDGNRTVNLWLTNPQGGAVLGGRTNSVLTIVDDELAAAGKIQFATRSNSVPEAGKFVTLTVNRIGGSTGSVSVNYSTADGTAIAGQNYVATTGTLVFGPGIPSKTIAVPIINDSMFESNEVFTVNLTSTTGGAALGTNTTTKVGIVNDDFGGTFAFKQSSYITNENSTNFVVTVVRTGGAASGVTVDYATADGTALDGVRYLGTSGTLTFGSNQLSKTFLVGVINDLIPNGNQSFTAHLSNATGGAKVSTNTTANTATLTVLDDESSVAFSNATYSASEGVGTFVVTVVRSGARLTPVGVSFNTADNTAFAGTDYRATNGILNFPANVASKTFSISITNDTIAQGNRTFLMQLSNPTGGTQLGAASNAVVTIVDNDVAGTIQFASANFTGSQGSNAIVKITRTGGLASGITVSLAINGITAVAGTDYLNVNPTVSFNAGESNKTILVTLPFNALNTVSRTATLSLSSPAGGVGVGLGVITSSTLTILHKPDANAVPIIGPIFMSANIGSTAVNITKGTFSGIVVSQSAGGFFFDFSWANGATIYPLYIFTFGAPAAIGATTINYNQGQLMDISKGLSGTQLQSWHVGVVSSTPDSASGTIVIDAIDTVNKRVSGRFSFHAFADVGTTPVTTPAFLEITNGKFRATYN